MSGAMRLLWMHENFVSARQGGNSRASQSLAAMLDAGWQIDLVCTTRSYLGEDYGTGQAGIEREGGLTIHRLEAAPETTRASQYIHFCSAALRYAGTLPTPDLVFSSTPSLPQVAPALLIASRHSLPLVLEVRDLWPAFLVDGGLLDSKLLLAALRMLESTAYRRADQVLSVSPGFVPYLQSMGIETARLQVAPTGADPALLDLPSSMGEQWRSENNLEGAFLVIYAGSFNKAYGLEVLCDAIERTRDRNDIHWLIAGSGHSKDRVEECVARNPTARYLGCLPKTELLSVLSAADVGINCHAPWPLLETTITGKLFDYLAMGLPVINLAPGQMAEIVRLADGGWQTERDPKQLAATVSQVAALDASVLRSKGQSGKKWVQDNMHGTSGAHSVAAAVQNARGSGRGGGLRQLAGCVSGAAWDLFNQRSRRSLEQHYADGRRSTTLRTALQDFLEQSSGVPGDLAIPEILGGRKRT